MLIQEINSLYVMVLEFANEVYIFLPENVYNEAHNFLPGNFTV